MTKMISRNSTIPTKKTETFSTAADNQPPVTINVLQGEREQASANKSLGNFDLSDIPPAPRGVPQIEVSFDVDANGILNVSAKDKATGKEQAITITANSGLSDEEIDGMVADAEQHADDDKKFAEMADLRNQADGMVHGTEKAIADLGDKVTDEEKGPITEAIDQLKEAIKGDDKDDIEAKLAKLTEVSGPVMQKVYADQAAEAQAAGGAEADAGPADDSVVDAEFTEVEDEEKKA